MAKHKRGGKKAGVKQSGPGKRPPLTHFLCVPMDTRISRPQLEASLQRFKSNVVSAHGTTQNGAPEPGDTAMTDARITLCDAATEDRGPTIDVALDSEELPQLPERAVRPVGTLHLTLGVMSLMEDDSIKGAAELLESLDLDGMLRDAALQPQKVDRTASTNQPKEEVSQSGQEPDQKATPEATASTSTTQGESIPASLSGSISRADSDSSGLTISLTGLHSMHSVKKTSILYAAPHEPTDRFYPFCRTLRARFQEAGFLVPDDRPLKLHATIVNTIYAKAGGRRGRAKAKNSATGQPSAATTEADRGPAISPPPLQREAPADASSKTTPVPNPEDIPPEEPPGDTSAGHGPNAKAPLRFDATALLQRYKDFVWASGVKIEKVAICKMGAKKLLDEKGEVVGEEYEEVASVRLPGADLGKARASLDRL